VEPIEDEPSATADTSRSGMSEVVERTAAKLRPRPRLDRRVIVIRDHGFAQFRVC
jgi:hypothetical protein